MTLQVSSQRQTLQLLTERAISVEKTARSSPARRLLIIGYSRRKLPLDGHMKAWSLYDGQLFRLLKRMQSEGAFPADVDVVILSSYYGLIRPVTLVSAHDERMTSERAREQAGRNRSLLRSIMKTESYREVFAALEQHFMEAIEPVSDWLPKTTSFRAVRGRTDVKMRELKNWLDAKD